MKLKLRTLAGISVLTVFFALPQLSLAGPPLICHAFDIGQAKTLPWSSDNWNLSGKETYDINHLVDDTAALLTPGMPVLVRMETLRRATLYAQKDPMVAKQLFARLKMRAQAANGTSQEGALAKFDYGYLVETFKQMRWMHQMGEREGGNISSLAADENGYALVEKAITERGGDSEMEFAAAIISLEKTYPHHAEHVRLTLNGASNDVLLARNLSTHFIGQNTETMADLFKKQ